MFYIKLTEDKDLTITVREPIYRGENLHQKIMYLLPPTVGEVDIMSAFVYLNYIRPDGTPDVVILERMPELYHGSYIQYTFPITNKFTRFPGEICSWLQIYTGDPSNPIVEKSGECIIHIQESKNIDQYMCEHQLTAIYQLQRSIEDNVSDIRETIDENIAEVNENIEKRADNIHYDRDVRELQLMSGDVKIGDAVIVPGDDYTCSMPSTDEEWTDMTDNTIDAGDEWEPM